LLAVLTVTLTSFALGGSWSAGGCGSLKIGSTPKTYTYVDLSCPGPGCDMQVGEPPGSNSNCGTGAGQCGCTLGDSLYCGYCPTAPADQVCTYCPPSSFCNADPCAGTCETGAQQEVAVCPAEAPIDCGASCCPTDYPTCCANSAWCGEDFDGCEEEEDDAPPADLGCAVDCASAGLYGSTYSYDGCCSGGCPSACADACGSTWYEVGSSVYGPCGSQDTACIQAAAEQAVAGCY